MEDQFVESNVRDFVAHGYSMKLAWQLTATLDASILTYVAKGRAGARNATVGDKVKQATAVLWAVLKTQQLMREFTKNGFRDHPSLTGEIGRFMLRNTNLTSVSRLETAVTAVRGDLATLKSKATSHEKSIAAVVKDVDRQATDIASLRKKVK